MNEPAARRTHRSPAARHTYTRLPRLQVTENSNPTRHVIVATGPIDIAGTATLTKAFRDAIAPRRRVLLDLSEVTFLAEAGLTALLDAHRQLAANGGELTLAGASRRIRRLLQITGNDRLLHLAPADRTASNTATYPARTDDRSSAASNDRLTR